MFLKSPSALEQSGYAVVLITWELTWVSDIPPSTRVFNFCRRWLDLKKVEAEIPSVRHLSETVLYRAVLS